MVKFIRETEELTNPLLRPLFNDLIDCEELLERNDTQFGRRSFVRATFAFHEAYLYWFKGILLDRLLSSTLMERPLNVTAIGMLQDSVFRPDKQGKLVEDVNRIPFLNYCAFLLRTAGESFDLDPAPFFSDNGWNELQTALKVRHRITHPKQPEDTEVADNEMDSVREAHRWIFNCCVALANRGIELAEQQNRLEGKDAARGDNHLA